MIPEVPHKRHYLLGHTKPFAADTLGFVLACAEAGLPMAKASSKSSTQPDIRVGYADDDGPKTALVPKF